MTGYIQRMGALQITTPIGPLALRSSARGLCAILFDAAVPDEPDALCLEAARQLRAYFEGGLRSFDLPMDPGGTPFQEEVWALLGAIPFGQTTSYGALANALGKPGAARAVGLANHDNPLAIVIPCHRVVGSNGDLTGYAGGLDKKRWLLRHEGAAVVRQAGLFG